VKCWCYVLAMSDTPKPRPGPMAFRAESKVTSQKSPPSSNAGGIGESQLTRETPTGSKELKVANLWVWLALGIILIPIGILAWIPLMIAGIALVVGVIVTNRNNKTENRLRNNFEQGGD